MKTKEKLKAAPEGAIRGYSVSKIERSTDRKLRLPDGRAIRIRDGERLLVINGEPKYVVQSAEDVIKCIRKYALDNHMPTFTVNDMRISGRVPRPEDPGVADIIMFLSIRKHDKRP